MAATAGPDIVDNGLVLALDAADFNSFKGEATVNLIPSPTVNAYPTTGNAWGTYNTNQYGSGTYFSIGTVSSVSNNIITMTSAHSLRTYDVMQPQTTGGGVTAGTNYFIKKVSSTSFTLHEYNSSQDGSQGYISSSTGTHKVYDSIVNDTRISVNATNFPTMWWGAPHLPNSGLVKELRYGEFNAIPNTTPTDCIRLHYIRTDDVKDGMSYGVDCTITPNSPVTISFYTRSANANAVGKQISYQIYNYSGGTPQFYVLGNFNLGPVGVWQRQTFNFTPVNSAMISYWFPVSTTGTYAWDWSCMQVEQKSYVTNFVAGTRGTTVATGGGWADLTGRGNNGEVLNGVRESNTNRGSLLFDGTNDYVDIPNSSIGNFGTNDFTVSCWSKPTVGSSGARGLVSKYSPHSPSGTGWFMFNIDGQIRVFITQDLVAPLEQSEIVVSVSSNIWYNFVMRRSSNKFSLFINGQLSTENTTTNIINCSSSAPLRIGSGYSSGYYYSGNVSLTKIYNRALTVTEIQQNFNESRSRFGI